MKMIHHINISYSAMRDYHYLWETYIENKGNFTIFCVNEKRFNCSYLTLNAGRFVQARPSNWQTVTDIRKNSELGVLVEGNSTSPPCTDKKTIEKFELSPICDFLKTFKDKKNAFLKMMKFTKQSPVFIEDDDEYLSVFSNDSISAFGYTWKENKVRHYMI